MAYTKYHSPWESTHLLSGSALNHIETQWDESKTSADNHNHDTRYYTKTLSEQTFYTLTNSVTLGFDADTLDGGHRSSIVSVVLPTGCITIWSGNDGDVPTGWHVCDGGTYGGKATPDLRDRFVLAAGDTYAVGYTGGPATWNGTVALTATVTIGAHALTTAEIPYHAHGYTDYYGSKNQSAANDNWAYVCGGVLTASRNTNTMASGDGTHNHSGSTATFTAMDPRPAYYSLYYIMKYA